MEISRERTGVEKKFYDLTLKIMEETGYKLYDLDYVSGSSTLKVFIMDPETNSALIDDCIRVDRAYNPYCETEEWIPDDFVLEVSSPGVYRSIKSLKHFEMAKNELISCTISGQVDSEKNKGLSKSLLGSKKFRGVLVDYNDNEIKIDIDGTVLSLDMMQIKKANLDPEIGG